MILSGTAVAQIAPLPSPSATIGLGEIQAHLHPDEILVVFQLDEPSSSRWVIAREHAVFDPIAGRTAISQAPADEIGALLFGDISTADGRPMLVVAEPLLRQRSFASMKFGDATLGERHPVAFADSVEALVHGRRTEADRLSMQLGWLAGFATVTALIVAFRRTFAAVRLGG